MSKKPQEVTVKPQTGTKGKPLRTLSNVVKPAPAAVKPRPQTRSKKRDEVKPERSLSKKAVPRLNLPKMVEVP